MNDPGMDRMKCIQLYQTTIDVIKGKNLGICMIEACELSALIHVIMIIVAIAIASEDIAAGAGVLIGKTEEITPQIGVEMGTKTGICTHVIAVAGITTDTTAVTDMIAAIDTTAVTDMIAAIDMISVTDTAAVTDMIAAIDLQTEEGIGMIETIEVEAMKSIATITDQGVEAVALAHLDTKTYTGKEIGK